MPFQEEHEPELEDIDDFHKPLRKSKLRLIILSFVIVAAVWALFQIVYKVML